MIVTNSYIPSDSANDYCCSSGECFETGHVCSDGRQKRKSASHHDQPFAEGYDQFIRLLGGTFALAVGSTLMLVIFLLSNLAGETKPSSLASNNSLRTDLASFSLSSSAITAIINDPAILGPSTPTSELTPLGLTSSMASYVLSHGYTGGFELVFILNACLAAVAAVASFFMIKHKELTRGDEEKLRAEALAGLRDGGKGRNDGAEKV